MTSDDEHLDRSTDPVGQTPPDAAPPPVPDAPTSAPPAPGGVYPPGVYPAVYGTPAEPTVAAASSPKKRRGLAAVLIGIVVVAFLKIGLPILVGTAVSGVLGGVFGGPFEKLPSDQKQAFEQRFEAATGDTLKGLSDSEKLTKAQAMLQSGLPRLSDELLVERIHLTTKLLMASDVATCARVARATATGVQDEDALSTAVGAMDTASIGRWFEIAVSAIEADAKGSPPPRSVPQAETERLFGDVVATFSDNESRQLDTLFSGTAASDADACSAMRAFYTHIEELPAAELALVALYFSR